MKVTDTSHLFKLEALGKAASGRRSPGLHVSAIYRDIEKTMGKYTDDETAESKRRGQTYQLGGFLWEGVFEQVFAELVGKVYSDLVIHQEVERDHITGSPDLLDTETETVIDTKMTWKSSSRLDNLEKNFWAWLVQLKAYCAMLGWRRARLAIFFVNGDYKDSGPQVKQLDFEFGEQEIEENWSMLCRHAQRRGWLTGLITKPNREVNRAKENRTAGHSHRRGRGGSR